jgi:cobalt-zinc-cadmium efflux system membrane fusion protein
MRLGRILCGLGLWMAVAGCGGSPPDAAAPAAGADTTTPGYFTVPADQLPHLEIAPVATATWATTVSTTGTVDWDNDHTTQAITQVSGPITRILVDAGAQVKAGQPLLYVASPDISNAVSAYRKAINRQALAQRNVDRSRDLLEHKAIAQRDMESVEADYNDAATDVQSALQQLRIFGIDPADLKEAETQNMPIRSELPMRAPISGTVVDKLVLPGQVIQAGMTQAFVISNVTTLWVQGHVYDKDLQSVHVGDAVDIHSSSFPDTFHGTVTFIGELIDPTTRTTPVRIVTQNPRALLKKDLFVDVVIHDKSSRMSLAVPTSAVLYDEQNFPFVYVQVKPGQFAQRQVHIGTQQDDRSEVLDGLRAGDQVVSQGSLFLQFANSYKG